MTLSGLKLNFVAWLAAGMAPLVFPCAGQCGLGCTAALSAYQTKQTKPNLSIRTVTSRSMRCVPDRAIV